MTNASFSITLNCEDCKYSTWYYWSAEDRIDNLKVKCFNCDRVLDHKHKLYLLLSLDTAQPDDTLFIISSDRRSIKDIELKYNCIPVKTHHTVEEDGVSEDIYNLEYAVILNTKQDILNFMKEYGCYFDVNEYTGFNTFYF